MNLPDYRLAVVNTTRADQRRLTLRSRVISLDNRLLAERVDHVDVRADSVTTLEAPLPLAPALAREGLVLVKLTLEDSHGATISDNVYWQSQDAAAQQRLNTLAPQRVAMTARPAAAVAGGAGRDGLADGDGLVDVTLTNTGNAPALNAKITMLGDDGQRVLPVYYDDNYVTLLPGETRHLEVHCPASNCTKITLRGWNVMHVEAPIAHTARQ
jgi:hypothetical protein